MGFCKSNKKSMPVVGLLTCNDCDVLRAKTGLYRQVTPRTIILPTMSSLSNNPLPSTHSPTPSSSLLVVSQTKNNHLCHSLTMCHRPQVLQLSPKTASSMY